MSSLVKLTSMASSYVRGQSNTRPMRKYGEWAPEYGMWHTWQLLQLFEAELEFLFFCPTDNGPDGSIYLP